MATLTGQPDMALIAELLEEIQRHPPAIAAKTLLAQHYFSIGWFDAATDYVDDLKRETPGDSEVKALEEVLQASRAESAKETIGANTSAHRAPVKAPVKAPEKSKPKTNSSSRPTTTDNQKKMESSSGRNSRNDLNNGYRGLRQKARGILNGLSRLQAQQRQIGTPQTGLSPRIQAILRGQVSSEIVTVNPTANAQLVARAIQANPEKGMEVAIADLVDVVYYMREHLQNQNDDHVRDALVTRKCEVEKGLPVTLRIYCELGFMHVEHEKLKRRYANDTTMSLMEPISEIPREDFYVTEDNYAWDLSELVQAITANGGVMRNPLSREMFTPKDVRDILMSPHGKPLAPLRAAQHDMAQGIRPETVERLERLATVMLSERESNQLASRKEIDEFQAYVATLPDREQKTIEAFRCPAYDSHARKAFDNTIGQTLRDAKATEMCIHKAGDFIKQAAAHLKEKRTVSEPDKSCVVM